MNQHFEHVTIGKQATIHRGGAGVSYDLDFPGQARKTIGVVLRASVPFHAEVAEVVEIVAGRCRARVGDGAWTIYDAGQRFHVAGQQDFELEALEPVHYVCHRAA